MASKKSFLFEMFMPESPAGNEDYLPASLRGHELEGVGADEIQQRAPACWDPTWMEPDSPHRAEDLLLMWDHTTNRPVALADGKYWVWDGGPNDDFHDWSEAK